MREDERSRGAYVAARRLAARFAAGRAGTAAALAALVAGVSALVAARTRRIGDWAVMTDEMLYAKLATSIGQTSSPLPSLHGELVPVFNVLYPLLLAPFYGSLDPPAAFHAAHVANAIAMASAAVPAYLLAREVVPRAWALGVALASVATPWMVLTSFLMSEAVAYPAFLWAAFAVQRAVAVPSARADSLALVAIGIAVLARVQLVAVAVVLPLVVLVHEVGYSVATSPGPRAAAFRAGVRTAAARHRVLAAAYAVAVVAAVVLAAAGSLGRAVGSYEAATEGPLLPNGVWRAAAVHLDVVAVAVGVAPLVLGAAWAASTAFRPHDKHGHALAVLTLTLVPALAVEAASYDLRFGGPGMVRDRYVFYVVPLLLACTTAAALEGRARWIAVPAVAGFFALTIRWYDFEAFPGLHVDKPAAALNEALTTWAGSLSPQAFVALAGLLLGVVFAAGSAVVPPRVFAVGVLTFVVAASAAGTRHAFDRVLGSNNPVGRPMTGTEGVVREWVDGVLPEGATAGIVPYPTSPLHPEPLWWDVEFWNRTVTRAFVDPRGRHSYTPFPTHRLQVDFDSGRISTPTDAPRYLVLAQNDARFRPAGPTVVSNYGLDLVEARIPYRADWATRGVTSNGQTRRGQPVTIRVFAFPGEGDARVRLELVLTAPPGTSPAYAMRAGPLRRRGEVAGGATTTVDVDLCVAARGHADVALVGGGASAPSSAAADRAAVVGILAIRTDRTGTRCDARSRG